MKKEKRNFYLKLGILLLFIIPLAYTGIILAVGVHEVIGHGFFSKMMGLNFNSFTLNLDGMGWAVLSYPEGMDPNTFPNFNSAIFLLAGPMMTLLLGVVLIGLAYIFRKRFFVSIGCSVLALLAILDGSPYLFWNAISPIGDGDIAKILSLYPSAFLRFTFLIIGGLMMFASIIFINLLFFKSSQKWFGNDIIKKSSKKLILLLFFFALQLAGWFAFDWNQLIPGIGQIPGVVGISFTALVLGFIYFKENWKQEDKDKTKWIFPAIIAWIIGIIIFLLTLFVFQYGVNL